MASRLPLICVLLVGIGVSVSTFGTERVRIWVRVHNEPHHITKIEIRQDDDVTAEPDQGGDSSGNDDGGQNEDACGCCGDHLGGNHGDQLFAPFYNYLIRRANGGNAFGSDHGGYAFSDEDGGTTRDPSEARYVYGRVVLRPGFHAGGSFEDHKYGPMLEHLKGRGDLGKVLERGPTYSTDNEDGQDGNGYEGQVPDIRTLIRSKRSDFAPLVEDDQGRDFEGHDGIDAVPAGQGGGQQGEFENQDGGPKGVYVFAK